LHPEALQGYYEFSYFMRSFFPFATNQANVALLGDTTMYVDPALTDSNYEHLFLTYDIFSGDPTSDPPANSLFNITNFQMLVNLGMSTPNIIYDSSLIYGQSFNLSSEWTVLTQNLGLSSEQQTYMLWLWLDIGLWVSYSGNVDYEFGLITNNGAWTFASNMAQMQLEFPMFIMAS
jgi:hypothetical protein